MKAKNISPNPNKLIEIYTEAINKEGEHFSLGYFIDTNPNYTTVISINECGMIESFQYRKNTFISKIVSSSSYLTNFKKIIHYNKSMNLYDPYSLTKVYKEQFEGKNFLNDSTLVDKQVSILTTNNDFILQGTITKNTNESFTLSSSTFNNLTENAPYEIQNKDIVLIDFLSIENKLIEQIKLEKNPI
ncbi:hypothetical protein [Facklamia sp. 7083-14-GEN3]|uniref:hypothetical protein n=1 Tax=Facklamia sp. 7083-14-GEN3 TaxID=2973478 RepID=UPI00215BB837|nr:hypothetical protein [Facklamia sp. 7083-14-GEN3]MCR8968489.1 hypothetical protein [Facklamia sp. 7083-14-GEN3]